MQNKFISFLKAYWILILLVVTKIALQFSLVHPCYELHRDEFLHLDQANHLAFGYISVPPFTSLLSKLIMLLGGGIFWIRFFPAMFGALTIVVVWLMVESLGGKLWAKLLASIAILFSVIARINILYQPNSFEILDWTLIFWALIQYTTTHKNQWLYTMAVFVTLGFYNKYNLIFLLFGLISGYTLSRERKIFITKSLWWAILLITVFIVPNIIWQIMHDFPVIKHLHALQSKQLDHNSGFGFLSDQLKFFASSILIILAGLFCLLFYKPFRSYRFVGICFISTITIFTLLKAKNYYALGLYPVIIAFGSLYTETIFKKWNKLVISLLMLIIIASFGLTYNIIYPVMSPEQISAHPDAFEKFGMLRWEDGKNHQLPQDFADMVGWQDMANKALMAYKTIPVNEQESTLIFCDNYGQAGALNYYNRGKMKEAYSFNTDYIFWLPKMKNIKNIILIGNLPNKDVLSQFETVQQTGTIENQYAREKGTCVFILRNGKPEWTSMFYKLAKNRILANDIF